MTIRSNRRATLLVAALVLLLFVAYLYNLTGWQIFDDEGEYLYQVWRMTEGDLPYRDFLTPQLPVYLYAGTAVMSLFGNSLVVMRVYSVLLAFAAALLLYAAGRRHRGPLAGALALVLFLVHPDVFRETRIFRNEPLFLLLITAGIVVSTWAKDGPQRRHLAAGGVLFALATLVKLFGLLPAAGLALWVLSAWWQRRGTLLGLVKDAAALFLPLVATLLEAGGLFILLVPDFLDLVLGHHLAQGSGQALGEIVRGKVSLFGEYVRLYPAWVSLAVISAALGMWRNDGRVRWVWQFAPLLGFFVLSRQLGQRHFMFILPALVLFAGWLLADLWQYRGRRGRIAVVALLLLLFVPAIRANAYRASWQDTTTQPLVDLIRERTGEDSVVLADDIGLAYYARRRTTYAGAALSHGAITSGQISTEQIVEEIVSGDVEMVLVDTSLLTGNHLVFLKDYPRFHRFLERNFEHLGNFRRDYQEIDVWWRARGEPFITNDDVEIATEDGTRFGSSLYLSGYTLADDAIEAGEVLTFTIYWTADGPANHYWSVFAHLIGPDGQPAGQDDKVPYEGIFPPTRWDAGIIVDDDYAIAVAPETPPGEYRLVVGMYDWQSGERLPLFDTEGKALPNDQVELAQPITVLP